MGVKVYVSGISGNKEVKKRQQRVFMILESKHIPFDIVDITEPGKENERDFMQNNSTSSGATVSDTSPRHPLPPQLFNDTEYCGDYDQFDLANEVDTLEQFLKVEAPVKNDTDSLIKEISNQDKLTENSIPHNDGGDVDRVATNGIMSSREASVESEKKPSDTDQTNEDNNVDDIIENNSNDLSELKKDVNLSEDLIANEQAAAGD